MTDQIKTAIQNAIGSTENADPIVSMSNNSDITNININPSDPNYNYNDWNNFNPVDWTASKINCHGFGDITVITNNYKPTIKLFLLREIATVLDYQKSTNLSRLLPVDDFSHRSNECLSKINNLATCYVHEINPRGMTILNYAAFNAAIMKSTKPNAKVIQQWIYGSVMPSIAETGKFESDNSNIIEFDKHSHINKNIIRSIITEELAEMSTQLLAQVGTILANEVKTNINSLREQLFSDLSAELQSIRLDLSNEIITDIKSNVNRLLSAKKLGNKLHSANEVVDFLNANYAPPGAKMTKQNLIEYIIHIKLIKKNLQPMAESITNKYLVFIKDPFNVKPDQIVFTKNGIQFIVDNLIAQGFTKL